MVKGTTLTSLIILTGIMSLITPVLATSHSNDYWYGYKIGKIDGSGGVYDSGDACQNGVAYGVVKNSNECDAGYHDGFYRVPP